MAFKNRTELLNNILNELALVTGTSIQTYTQPIIEDYIQSGFNHLFSKRFWPHLTKTTYHTLDGAGGVVDDNTLSDLDYVHDIQWIREAPYREQDEIPYYKDGIFDSQKLAYTDIAYGDPGYANKRIIFNPLDSTVEIAIRSRRILPEFGDNDVIPFDYICLTHYVAMSLLASDGMNPGAQQLQMTFFNDRYEQLITNEGDKKITSKRNRFDSEFTVAP